ncbi:MAG: transcriptional regulator [Rhizobiaceae bacterium MnEN-MB40S]|nr:MAG: transcriptional regulator [Rhizobiaceae bacterium MnEN-MB40S]
MSVQLQRAIDILELIEEAERPVGLAEIARQLDMPKSAAHRLLQVWVKRGYVEQEEDVQRYSATLKLAILGFAHLNATGIRDICHPDMRLLAKETGELVRLAVVVGGDSMAWVAEAQGARDGLRYDGNLGRQAVLHATAAGKAWLATLTDEEAARVVLAQGFPEAVDVGPNALRAMRALQDELESIRSRGYSTAMEEASIGVNAVAAAIFEGVASDKVVGSVIVVGPSARMTPARIAEIAPRVMTAAKRLSSLWPIKIHLDTGVPDQGAA